MKVNIDIVDNKIILITDDPIVKTLFSGTTIGSKYDFIHKRYIKSEIKVTLYESGRTSKGSTKLILNIGWGVLILNLYKDYISPDDKNKILRTIYQTNYRTTPFSNLRDYQNDDILHLLKYKYGLFCNYTSYGKTELIATLVNYLYSELKLKVLLLVPSSKCKDELVKRCKERFNINVPSSDGLLDIINSSGVTSSKRFKKDNKEEYENTKNYLESIDCVLADEVEYVIGGNGGKIVLDMCKNAYMRYGFSGTADKIGGNLITFSNGITDVVINNRDLIGYFGQALIYRVPIHLDINLVTVKTSCFNNITFTDENLSEDSNIYQTVLNTMWTNPESCDMITKLIKYYPRLFIPINNLTNIIDNWISNYWIGKFRILLICGAGYIYYDLDRNSRRVELSEACDLIKNDEVDVIPSTSSGFRALDLPGLTNILLIQGKIAGVVLQSIGRVARGKVANIIDLRPKPYKPIPVYTKGVRDRSNMIKKYYKYCFLKIL
jgi:hypothetical protein